MMIHSKSMKFSQQCFMIVLLLMLEWCLCFSCTFVASNPRISSTLSPPSAPISTPVAGPSKLARGGMKLKASVLHSPVICHHQQPINIPVFSSLLLRKIRGGMVAVGAEAVTTPTSFLVTEEMITSAYEWLTNLGAPAALIAGAVVATMYENMKSGDLEIQEGKDPPLVTVLKKCTKILLLSAFALEVICIFVTIVTGTMLLSRPKSYLMSLATVKAINNSAINTPTEATPLSFLQTHFEFEFLMGSVAFLQGLFHWLAAIALGHGIALDGETSGTRRLNIFIASSIVTCLILLLSFFNSHMTFYNNYFHMVQRLLSVMLSRFFHQWPPRPLVFILYPSLLVSLYTGYLAFREKIPSPSGMGITDQQNGSTVPMNQFNNDDAIPRSSFPTDNGSINSLSNGLAENWDEKQNGE
jgi:hypothetical protein